MKSYIGYMDKIDFDCELGPNGPDINPPKIWPDEESCRKNLCGDCGIVKVKVSLVEVIEKTKL